MTAIVIPAFNEADNLGALLDDCLAQVPPADEIVVVDAGSTDGTAGLLRAYRERHPQIAVVEAPGAAPGGARNAGIAAARSDVVATLDSGSRVGGGWLAALTSGMDPQRASVAIGVTVADARNDFERATGWFTLRSFKPPDQPGPLGREFYPAGRNGFCFRRVDWEAAGRYPESLGQAEEKVLLRRLRELGAEVRVVPEAVVRWRPRRSLGEVYRQYRLYGRRDALTGVDRQNELVPLAMQVVGLALAVRAARGDRRSGIALSAGVAGYLGLFTAAAVRDLRVSRPAAWVPVLRLVVDAAKVHGFLEGTLEAQSRGRRRPT